MDDLFELFGTTEAEHDEYLKVLRPRWCCGKLAKLGTADVEQPCRFGHCIDELCECGAYLGGWGPAGCPCDDDHD